MPGKSPRDRPVPVSTDSTRPQTPSNLEKSIGEFTKMCAVYTLLGFNTPDASVSENVIQKVLFNIHEFTISYRQRYGYKWLHIVGHANKV